MFCPLTVQIIYSKLNYTVDYIFSVMNCYYLAEKEIEPLVRHWKANERHDLEPATHGSLPPN